MPGGICPITYQQIQQQKENFAKKEEVKRIICTQLENQKKILKKLRASKKSMTYEDYAEHYRSFDHMPFAFADIEMVFDDNAEAVVMAMKHLPKSRKHR